MTDTVLTLITPASRIQDADGVWRSQEETRREILARMDSIDRAEYFAAGRLDFRPEYRFTVFAGDYAGEALCEHGGERYAIYRSYHVPGTDDLELYVKAEAGVRNGT